MTAMSIVWKRSFRVVLGLFFLIISITPTIVMDFWERRLASGQTASRLTVFIVENYEAVRYLTLIPFFIGIWTLLPVYSKLRNGR